MIPGCTGPDCASLTHRIVCCGAIVGRGFESGDEMPTACAAAALAMNPQCNSGRARTPPRAARTCGCRKLLTCDVSDLTRPGEPKRTPTFLQRSVDAFCATPFDATRSQLHVRSQPLHRATMVSRYA
jgi:hypothetical protein